QTVILHPAGEFDDVTEAQALAQLLDLGGTVTVSQDGKVNVLPASLGHDVAGGQHQLIQAVVWTDYPRVEDQVPPAAAQLRPRLRVAEVPAPDRVADNKGPGWIDAATPDCQPADGLVRRDDDV